MNEKVKKLWIDALRSGDYKQGKGRLASTKDAFCCLGVLCDLAVQANVIDHPVALADGTLAYGAEGCDAYLPPEIVRWAGVESRNPRFGCVLASSMNDNGGGFAEIATLIETHL